MYYMVYYEHSTGCSSPDDIYYSDFDKLDEARDFMKKLQKHNLLSDAELKEKHISIYDWYSEIRLCIVLEEACC